VAKLITTPEDLLKPLDEEQRLVATAIRGPVLVIAGAGTGKTRAITHRIAYGVAIGAFDPEKTMALTFTAKAAGEMRSRLRTLGIANVSARTFHAAALRQLIYFWPDLMGGRFPQLLTSKTGFIQESAARIGSGIKNSHSALREIAGEIEWSKTSSIAPEDYVEAAKIGNRSISLSFSDIAKTYESYEVLKRQERTIDFEDVLLLLIGMLEEESEVRSKVRQQYRTFTVDEYQDVSPLQQRLLDLWIGNRKDICVVGDPAQTIYSFSGATPTFLLNFSKKYPDAQVVRLSRGYRSTQEIMNLANKVLRSGDLGHELVAGEINHGASPEIKSYETFDQEINTVMKSVIAEISAGNDPNQIALLVRTNNQIEAIEKVLRKSGVEYQVRSRERFFERPALLDALRIIRSASVLSTSGENWIEEMQVLISPLGDNENLRALMNFAKELRNEGIDSLRGFLREIEERKEQNNPPALPGITLATLHSAKGLEWRSVYLLGISNQFLPWPQSPIDEERRLFYVGITRAMEKLEISYAGAPSPFIKEILFN
jgi:DNA helicase-2/ATP-dependent DNA helicase PcrA